MNTIKTLPRRDQDPELGPLQKLRRNFHQYPELMWQEYRTTAQICQKLKELDIDITVGKGLYDASLRAKLPDREEDQKTFMEAREQTEGFFPDSVKGGFTGVVGYLRLGNGGPKIGIRVDIDALPVRESIDSAHLPVSQGFESCNNNMHACGHDGHITVGLGLAQRLKSLSEIDAHIYLFFQPAEEGGMGGLAFSSIPIVSELDYFMALHLGFRGPRQLICGVEFLSATKLKVVFKGRPAHGAVAPNLGRNALLAAANAITGFYGISRHGDGATRVNVGKMYSDNASNIIPDLVSLELDVRGETNELRDYMIEQATSVIQGAALMNGVSYEISPICDFISAKNSPDLIKALRKAALKVGVPEEAIIDQLLIKGCEDATYMMQKVQQFGGKALYMSLTCDTRGGHHNSSFDIDEDLMLWGVDIFEQVIRDLAVSEL